jgi:hypothetical protein
MRPVDERVGRVLIIHCMLRLSAAIDAVERSVCSALLMLSS